MSTSINKHLSCGHLHWSRVPNTCNKHMHWSHVQNTCTKLMRWSYASNICICVHMRLCAQLTTTPSMKSTFNDRKWSIERSWVPVCAKNNCACMYANCITVMLTNTCVCLCVHACESRSFQLFLYSFTSLIHWSLVYQLVVHLNNTVAAIAIFLLLVIYQPFPRWRHRNYPKVTCCLEWLLELVTAEVTWVYRNVNWQEFTCTSHMNWSHVLATSASVCLCALMQGNMCLGAHRHVYVHAFVCTFMCMWVCIVVPLLKDYS